MTEEEFRSGKGPAFNPTDHYIAACNAVCSPNFDPDKVQLAEFRDDLKAYIALTQKFDKYKKLMFRGRSRSDVGLPHFFPTDLTVSDVIPFDEADLVHGIVGVITESGELAEILLSMAGEEKPDKVNAVEEAGDITWYLSRILKWTGHTFNQCFKINIDKLHGRHGRTFNFERDGNRDLGLERLKLETGVGQADLLDEIHATGIAALAPRTSDMSDIVDAEIGRN